MANVIDPCCVNIQMTKADRNNNINDGLAKNNKQFNIIIFLIIIEIVSPSEQCDVLQNGADDKSENVSDLL